MGLTVLILGLLALGAPHLFVMRRAARAAVIARIGEGPYKLAFAFLSLLGIALIGWGFARYRAAGMIDVWTPPSWARHVTVLMMWPAMVFAVAAYVPGELKRALKHPLLAGVKLWAAGHLIANGDLGSILLFGSILAWAVVDRVSLKARGEMSALPLPIGGRRNDMVAIIVGTILYFAMGLVFHPLLIGAAVFGTPALGT